MKEKGYEIFKARGIAFRDKQKVYTKGSEVGYSLQTIEKILALKPELREPLLMQKEQKQIQGSTEQIKTEKQKSLLPKSSEETRQSVISKVKDITPETKEEKHQEEQFKILEQLIKPEHNNERVNPELLKKKKRKRHHLRL